MFSFLANPCDIFWFKVLSKIPWYFHNCLTSHHHPYQQTRFRAVAMEAGTPCDTSWYANFLHFSIHWYLYLSIKWYYNRAIWNWLGIVQFKNICHPNLWLNKDIWGIYHWVLLWDFPHHGHDHKPCLVYFHSMVEKSTSALTVSHCTALHQTRMVKRIGHPLVVAKCLWIGCSSCNPGWVTYIVPLSDMCVFLKGSI